MAMASMTVKNLHGTNPNNPDSDADGFSDGEEHVSGTDPMPPSVL